MVIIVVFCFYIQNIETKYYILFSTFEHFQKCSNTFKSVQKFEHFWKFLF